MIRTSSRTARLTLIRRAFGSIQELADLINRSHSYCHKILTGRGQFTRREQLIILAYLGEPPERAREYFPEEEEL